MQHPVKYPVDIIAAFNPVGQIKPLYLRVENEEHELITLTIHKVLSHKQENYGGLTCIHYYCDIIGQEDTHFYCDVYYYIETHKWMLYRPGERLR